MAGLAVLASLASPASAATTPPLGAQSGTFAYVANGGSDRLTMINTADNTVTGTFPVRTEPDADPNGVAVSPDGTRVYVTNFGDGTPSAIDTATNAVIEPPIDGFDMPLGIAIGSRTVGATPAGLTLKVQPNGKDKDAPGALSNPGATLKARLTSGGRPLAGEEVLFSTGSKALCIETTDGRGEASCAVPGWRNAPDCYRAAFLGTATHAATRAPTCPGQDRRRP